MPYRGDISRLRNQCVSRIYPYNFRTSLSYCSWIGLVFSALGVFIRDIGQMVSFIGLALLYSSGVFYSAEKAEQSAAFIWTYLQWNSILQIIDSLRQIILWGGEPNWQSIVYAWVFGIITMLFGSWFFNRLRPAFADVL